MYHWLLAKLSAAFYGWPSNKLIVIGVTGTKGKSTTCYLIYKILKEALRQAQGKQVKVGMSSGILFSDGAREWLNDLKMTMPGRFKLQKMLSSMVKNNCQYAVIETTSEGIKQYRHLGINYDVVVFTNLYPEHIESHGSFEKYKIAKGKLFKHLTAKPKKKIFNKKTFIVNLDDKYSDYFLQFPADKKYGFTIKKQATCLHQDSSGQSSNKDTKNYQTIKAGNIELNKDSSSFIIQNSKFKIHLLGEMNIYNSLAAITIGQSLGITLETSKQVLEKVKIIPGRQEFIDLGQPFKVIVDYAHDPESLRQLFETILDSKFQIQDSKLIHVFGATGGGRDKSKRSLMGEISDKNSDIIILTNDDPYEEDPQIIIDQVAAGIQHEDKLIKIIDRQKAIQKALALAKVNDLVLITGKGSEQVIVLKDGKHQWDDRQVVRELLAKNS